MDIIAYFFIFMIGMILLLICALIVSIVFRHFHDPYDMKDAMVYISNFKSEEFIRSLNDIIVKMENCPTIIPQHIPPIEVYGAGKDKLLIVGDKCGKPRLFAFTIYDSMAEYEYVQLRDKDKRFKKFGLKHSIDVEEVKMILAKAEKRTFKAKLEETQEREIYNFFRK